jgi:hypothetical protein
MMRRMRSLARDESGVALVVLLLVALFVGLVGVDMINDTVSEVQIAVNESNAQRARYLAEAGIAYAVAQLTVSNTWTGPVTQTLGSGSFTVQVDGATSQAGATGAVKSIVSTGDVLTSTVSSGQQTVRETFLVLPQAFTKALLSDTTVVAGDANNVANTTITNTVLRQLGTIHANNVLAGPTAVTLQNGSGTVSATGQITASRGAISIGPGTDCTACATATNQAVIPFPSFNFATYCSRASAAGTLFTSNAAFTAYVDSNTVGGTATLGSPSSPVTLFVDLNGGNFQPGGSSTPNIVIYGSLIVYSHGGTGCSFSANSTPAGDVQLNRSSLASLTITSENAEPALAVGGGVWVDRNNCRPRAAPPITINGFIYALANTDNPAVTAPSGSGLCVYGSDGGGGAMHVNGEILGNVANDDNFDSLTYDPSIFYAGLPSALNPPGPPFVVLPISWTSGK